MKKFMQKKLNQKGLTLVELLAVIVILGIIAAIAIPAIGSIIENSRVSAIKGDAQNTLAAANMYFTENPGAEPVLGSKLQSEGFLENVGSAKGLTVTYKKGGNTIDGTATAKNTTVTFSNATNENISESGKSTTVNGVAATPPS